MPKEAAELGLPEDLALTLIQACLPLTAAVQPKSDVPPPSPDTLRWGPGCPSCLHAMIVFLTAHPSSCKLILQAVHRG